MEQQLNFRYLVQQTKWKIIKQFGFSVLIAYIIPIFTVSLDINSKSVLIEKGFLGVLFNVFSWVFISISLVVIVSINVKRLLLQVKKEMDIVYHRSMWLAESTQSSQLTIHEFIETNNRIDAMQLKIKNMFQTEKEQKKEIAFQVSALTHDLKTPLTVIKGNSELLQFSNLTESDQQSVKDIHRASLRLEDYFNQLIDYSKAFYLRKPELMSYSLVELEPIIRNETYYLVDNTVMEYHSFLPENSSLSVKVDLDLLIRSVVNLLTNAMEYADDLNKKISITLSIDSTFFKIFTRNNGPKFSDSVLENFSTLFYREDESRRSSESHFGIGLSFVKRTMQLHGGKIELKNSDEEAQVTLFFPLEREGHLLEN